MKNKKIIIVISSLAILAIALFATYNFYIKSPDQESAEENIVANYKGVNLGSDPDIPALFTH
jgi:hypothetical protein